MTISPAIPRLDIRNLRRSFDGRAVVDDVSFSLAPGQVTCLLGPSGCGKSTILRMIAGVETPERGEIRADGKCLWDENGHNCPPEQRQIGLMFQDFALFPHLNVAQNVAFGLRALPRREIETRTERLLADVGLAGFSEKYPHQLSGGEQQRVALARALGPKPRIMLMDEPFSGLDNRLRDEIRDDTLDILRAQDTAVLLVTHEPEEALRMADSIALMRAGRVVQQGSPYNIYNAPVDKQAVAFFSDINVIVAEVRGALAETPFGRFLAPGHADGSQIEIVIRPQHVALDFDRNGNGPIATESHGDAARARVVRARFLGAESLIDLRTESGDLPVRATVPGVFLPEPGTAFWLTLPRQRCYVFPV